MNNNNLKPTYFPRQSNYRKVLLSRMANGDAKKMPNSGVEQGLMCRLCLSSRGKMCNIFLSTIQPVPLPKVIYSCTGVVVKQYDGLPDIICDSCYRKLKIFKSFRDQCQRSDQILRNIGSSNTKPPARQDLKLNTIKELEADAVNEACKRASNYNREHETVREISRNIKQNNLQYKFCKSMPYDGHKSYCLRRNQEVKKTDYIGMKKTNEPSINNSVVVTGRNRLTPCPSRLFRKRRRLNYACTLCGKGFLRRANLAIHLRSHSSDEYKAGTRVTAGKDDDMVHYDRTYPEIAYKCKMCLCRFPDKLTLLDHFQSHEEREKCFSLPLEHTTEPRNSYNDIKGITVYTCKSCKKQFIDKDNLKAHIKLHQFDLKENACDLCENEDFSGKKLQNNFDSYKDMFNSTNKEDLIINYRKHI